MLLKEILSPGVHHREVNALCKYCLLCIDVIHSDSYSKASHLGSWCPATGCRFDRDVI
jgi:hypothetical protein